VSGGTATDDASRCGCIDRTSVAADHRQSKRLRCGKQGRELSHETLFSREEAQRRHVMRVLESVGGNKVRAAEILGIGRATIYQLLSRMQLEKSGDMA
jgi:DNA-binding NtrC family response regulator